jgi:coenzyme F420-reducing hydrogenase delta subunit
MCISYALHDIFTTNLTKGKVDSLNAGTKEFDLEGSAHVRTTCAGRADRAGAPNPTRAVRGGVDAVTVTGSGAVECHMKRTDLPSFVDANAKSRSRLWNQLSI